MIPAATPPSTPGSVPPGRWRRFTTPLDAGLALGAGVLLMTDFAAATEPPRVPVPVAVGLLVILAATLAVRRSLPLGAYVVNTVALGLAANLVDRDGVVPYPNLIVLYSVGLYATRRRALAGPVVMLVGVAAYFASDDHAPILPIGVVFGWLAAWAGGYLTARRREELEAIRARMRAGAIADERTRIARELHDLIGHTVNVMVVQAGAGRLALDRDPDKTRELLRGIEQTGRDALSELDRVLGILRDAEDGTGVEPPGPGLAGLPALVARMAQAGLAVTAAVDPTAGRLPRSLDLSVYRVVQEALTNALRHGGARAASVTVRRADNQLQVEVRDDGRGAPPGYQPGRGLVGIAERAAVFGGRLDHGPAIDGGFRLTVWFPVL
ncbi:histidine kinase [Luedemannella flava]|uniref:histidine kinase n=1 Tax=Luedemannella flava TaxID=349316 RepID=A0ABP4Z0Q0_9ACTN